jgi:hypothetical protein
MDLRVEPMQSFRLVREDMDVKRLEQGKDTDSHKAQAREWHALASRTFLARGLYLICGVRLESRSC